MSQSAKKSVVAVIDSKPLRRASILSFLEPWAKSEGLLLVTFDLDQGGEALRARANLRMVILSVGGESISKRGPMPALRAIAGCVPFVVISDREDAQEIAAACDAGAKGFISSGINGELTRGALSFILRGGSFFPPSVVHQSLTHLKQVERDGVLPMNRFEPGFAHEGHGTLATSMENVGSGPKNLTIRQQQVLERVRLGKPNKVIARELGMVDATVKVHIRQLLRKFGAANRTQLALGPSLATEELMADDNMLVETSAELSDAISAATEGTSHPKRTLRLITPSGQFRRQGR